MNKGSIVERLCSDLDRKEPRYKSPTLILDKSDDTDQFRMSTLCYMKINFKCNDDDDVFKSVTALCNSGSQMTLISLTYLLTYLLQQISKKQYRELFRATTLSDGLQESEWRALRNGGPSEWRTPAFFGFLEKFFGLKTGIPGGLAVRGFSWSVY